MIFVVVSICLDQAESLARLGLGSIVASVVLEGIYGVYLCGPVHQVSQIERNIESASIISFMIF